MKRHIITIAILLVISCSSIKAQQQLQLYTMDRVLQSYYINPALESPYEFHIGGTIIPLVGQLPPAMYIHLQNTAFSYNDIMHFGQGLKSDKLVLDLDNFMTKFKQEKANQLRSNSQIEIFTIGFQGKKTNVFWTINVTEKIFSNIAIPYDLMDFVLNGNSQYMRDNKTHDFSRLGINATAYTEIGLGANFAFTDNVQFGVRGKFLVGQANIDSQIKKLSLETIENEGYIMKFNTDAAIRVSMPLFLSGAQFTKDTIIAEINKEAYGDYFAFRNLGVALDLGVQYKPIEEVKVFASLNDLGTIRWNKEGQKLHSRGNYDFYGIEIKPVEPLDTTKYKNQGQAILGNLKDSLVSIFMPEFTEDIAYTTALPTTFHVGGEYKLHDMIQLGLLYRGEIYKKNYIQSGTIYVNAPLTHWVSLHTSYTITHHSYNNVGFGLTLCGGPFLWYFACDNIVAAFAPHKSRMFNLRMGLNIITNNKKKANKPRYYKKY